MKQIIILVFLITLLITSCKKKEPSTANNITNDFTINDFPLALNDSWTYEVSNATYGTVDTVTLSIISMSSLNNGIKQYRCNIINSGMLVDSGIYSVSNDTIIYQGLDTAYSYFGNFKLVMPFKDSSKWIGFYPVDTIIVVSKQDSTSFLHLKYYDVYNINRAFNLSTNYYLVQSVTVEPKIGIISNSIDIKKATYPEQQQAFLLLSYKLH